MMITLRQRRGMPLRTQGRSWYTDWCSKSSREPGAVMTVYEGTSFAPGLTATGYALFRAGIKGSAGTGEDLAASLRRRHERNGTRWRLLSPLAQAVLVIAFVRTNLTYAELAAGFGISESTCWRGRAEGGRRLGRRGPRGSPRRGPRAAGKGGRGQPPGRRGRGPPRD